MTDYIITIDRITAFIQWLKNEERSEATINKYLHSLLCFAKWLGTVPVTKSNVTKWKEHLLSENYSPSTINGKLTALDRFFIFSGWDGCRVKHLKLQRRMFRSSHRELTRDEYTRLINTAQSSGNERLALLMETICSTGIRVSEVKYITTHAIDIGQAEISLKGKIRTILLPGKLCRKLRKYAHKNKIASGELFITRSGQSLSRKQIWAEMKEICSDAHVEESKVFPHNLRHLFAVTFYKVCRDVAKLADVLGHSSIETTRIYLMTTGAEHIKTLERLQLVL